MKKESNHISTIVLIALIFILGIAVCFKMNSYKITYVVDNELYKTMSVRKNSTIEDIPRPEKEGYAFIGWYDESEKALEAKTVVTKDLVFYARWAKIVTEEEKP